jgi:hypothetical protein
MEGVECALSYQILFNVPVCTACSRDKCGRDKCGRDKLLERKKGILL